MTTAIIKKSAKSPTWKGTVVSIRMKDTIVVAVQTLKAHPKYKKQYQSTKRYKVHTDGKEFAKGDVVIFRECRPLSKQKHHTIVTE